MGNGHLDIGQGVGSASVFNASPAIQQFGNIVAQQRAQKQADDQALINQASQLKPDQIRDADRGDYINKYNDWKQSAINANNLPRNSRDRLDALANSQSKYNDLGNFISESKKEGANEHQVATMRLSQPHMFSDDANGQIVKSMQSPMSHPDFIPGNNYNQLERFIDKPKIDDGFDKAGKELLKQQGWSNPIQSQGVDKQGNKTGVVTHNERSVDPSDLLATYAHMATISPDIQAYLQKQYGNINGSSPHETMMMRLQQNAIDRGDLIADPKTGALTTAVSEKTKPEFKANYAPDKFYAHYDYRLANPAGGQVPSQPQSMNIPFSGKAGVVSNSPNYVPVSLSKKNFAGAQGIDMSTGKPESPLNSSDDYSIVGAGDFPIIKHGVTNNPKLNGTLAQPDFVHQNPNAVDYKRMVHVQQKDAAGNNYDHLIPYENLPKNVANQKDVKQALAGFNKTPVYGKQKAKSDPLGLGL